MYNFLKDLQISFRTASEFNKRKKDNYLIIKYEDLCSNLQNCMELICAFLNIEFSERLMETTVAGIPSGANSSFNKTSAPGVIIKNSLDRKRKITDKEIKMLSAFVFNYANDLGYQLPRVSKLRSLFIRLNPNP
jgi:hypothetical protein